MYNSFSEYLKLAFKNISKNPILIFPKVMILLIYLISGIIGYFLIDNINNMQEKSLIFIIGILILVSLVEILIEAGVLNMIKISMKEKPTLKDFIYGIKKYSIRIILGNVLIIAIGALVLFMFLQIINTQQNQIFWNSLMNKQPYDERNTIIAIIISFIILVLPFLIFCFSLTFWKVILVNENCEIQKAFGMSIKFVRKNIGLTIVISILNAIFTNDKNSKEFKQDNNFILKYNDLISHGYFNIIWVCLGLILKTLLNVYFDIIYFNIYVDRKNCLEDIEE